MIVRLTQNGTTLYVNTDHVAIVSAHPQLVNQTNVTLANGLNIIADGAATEIAISFGYEIKLSE